MDELSVLHIEWLRRQNDRSPETIRSRIRVLTSLRNAGTATREEVERWWESRANLARGTRAVDLSHLRSFYAWARIYNHRLDDPSVRVRPVTPNPQPAKKASGHDLRTLLNEADLEAPIRRAIMLGAFAGLRIAETAALSWDDVDMDADTITVRHGKGDRARVVDVSPMLLDWLAPVRRGCNVVTGTRERIQSDKLRRQINRAMKRAGVEATSHALRHWYGMTAYQSSGDLLAVAEQLGHASVNTTKIYARASSDVKRKIASSVMRGWE